MECTVGQDGENMWKIAPEERKKFLLLLLLIAVAIGIFGYRLFSGGMADRTLEAAALRFLEAGDAGDFELCRKLTGLDGQRFAVFRANRSSLGALKERTLVSRSPLRFNQRTGWLFFFNGNFENGAVREEIAVLTEPGKEPDVYSVRYEYARLPRPVSRVHYSGSAAAAVRAQVERCAEAYDHREWKYFEAIARRETGNERRGAGRGLENFRKRFGDPVARSLMQEVRYQETLPGCLHHKYSAVKIAAANYQNLHLYFPSFRSPLRSSCYFICSVNQCITKENLLQGTKSSLPGSKFRFYYLSA